LSVRPSPALVVPADLNIGDCARKMRDHDVGSLLVVRASVPHDLIGIFTERDLIQKIDEIQHGGYWKKSISTVMSHPVITISVYEVAKAAEMMIRCHIRHLPVVYEDDDKKQHLAGMISMRDIFSEMVEKFGKAYTSALGVKIAVASRDEVSRKVLTTLFSQGDQAWVEEVPINSGLLKQLFKLKVQALVLDLDFVAAGEWAALLHEINHESVAPATVVLFTPGFHDPKNVEILHKLGKSGRITAFAKPINVLEVLQSIRSTFDRVANK
jgi:CBS domain-containing protein